MVEDGYGALPFPFAELEAPALRARAGLKSPGSPAPRAPVRDRRCS